MGKVRRGGERLTDHSSQAGWRGEEVAHDHAERGGRGSGDALGAKHRMARNEVRHGCQRVRERAKGAVRSGAAVTGELSHGAGVAAVVAAAAVAKGVRVCAASANVPFAHLARRRGGSSGKRGEAGRQSVEDYA